MFLRLGLGLSDGRGASNAAPTDILLSADTVDEDAELGHVVGTLSATDPEDDAVTFSLVDDAGGLFGIDGNNLIVTGVLDYETSAWLGSDTPLAVIDFQAATYTVGATSHTLGEMLPGAGTTLDPGDISAGDGWFPQEEQFSAFGEALESVIEGASGVVVVVDAECVEDEGIFQFPVASDAHAGAIEWRAPTDGGTLEFNGWPDTLTIVDVSGRIKLAFRIADSGFAVVCTGKAEQSDNRPELFEPIDQDNIGTFIAAGVGAAFKVYSVKFYVSDVDMVALVES